MSFKKRASLVVLFGSGLFFALQKTAFAFGLKYQLLESLPGFHLAGTDMTDLRVFLLSIYKFGIWTVGIAGLFMLVVGGFWYMTSAGNVARAGSAKSIIFDSILGIIVAMSAYLVLYVINPDLTRMSIDFTSAQLYQEGEEDAVTGTEQPPISTGELTSRNGYPISTSVKADLDDLQANMGIKTQVTSGLRTLTRQQQLIKEYCGTYPTTAATVCHPSVCKLLPDGAASRCPHTTGKATDIWAVGPDGAQALSQKQCIGDGSPVALAKCFANPYQRKLIDAMKARGYCVLQTEPWHFEKPKMSTKCGNF